MTCAGALVTPLTLSSALKASLFGIMSWRYLAQSEHGIARPRTWHALGGFRQCGIQSQYNDALVRSASAIHLWTPPFRQGKTLGSLLRVVGCCHLSGLRCGRNTAAGLYGSSRTGSRSLEACSKHSGKPWLSRSRLADCCAILSVRSPSRPRDRGQPTPPRPELCRCHL